MKKKIAILLAAVMMLSCLAATAFAAKPGDTVTVSFSTSDNPGFATYLATIDYDETVLTLTAIEAGELSSSGMFSGEVSSKMAGFITTKDVTSNGVLFTATFTVNENAPAGEYPVTAALDTKSTANAADVEVVFTITGETVVIEAEETTPEETTPEETTPEETTPEETTPEENIPEETTQAPAEEAPETGDISNMGMPVVLLVAAMIAMFGVALYDMKKRRA